MRLLIHAGVHRTGSTSIQRLLAANRPALAARGIVYPGDGPHHQALAGELRRGNFERHPVLATLAAAREVAGEAGTVVLSGEDFSSLKRLGWLPPLLDHAELRVLFYLRRQDHWLMSWYSQHVGWPLHERKSRMSPNEFLDCLDDFFWIDYEWLLGRWAKVVGDERIIVGVVEPGQIEDVSGDVLSRLGLDAADLPRPPVRANRSLPVHLLDIARNLSLSDLDRRNQLRLLRALRTGLADKATAARTVYSAEQRAEILARFEASNRAVARRFLGRDALFLEPSPDPAAPVFRLPDLPPDRLIAEWIAPVFHAVLKRTP